MQAFNDAKEKREQFIKELQNCSSSVDLASILEKYDEQNKNGFLNVPSSITADHQKILYDLDSGIHLLVKEKKERFRADAPAGSQSDEMQVGRDSVKSTSSVTGNNTMRLYVENMYNHELDNAIHQVGEKAYKLEQGSIEFKKNNLKSPRTSPTKSRSSPRKASNVVTRLDFGESNDSGKQLDTMKSNRQNRETTVQEFRSKLSPFFDGKIHENEHGTVVGDWEKDMLKRYEQLAEIKRLLLDIRAKQEQFNDKSRSIKKNNKLAAKYEQAALAAEFIYDKMLDLSADYIEDGDLKTFKSASKSILDNSNDNVKKLQEHRGCKAIIINILAIICSFGYAYYKGGLTLFNPPTDSANKISALKKSINALSTMN